MANTISREEWAALSQVPPEVAKAWQAMRGQWGGAAPKTPADITAAVQEMQTAGTQSWQQKQDMGSATQIERLLRTYYQNPSAMPPETQALIPQLEQSLERIKPGALADVKKGMQKDADAKTAADAAEKDRVAQRDPTYGMTDAQKQNYFKNEALDERFGQTYSWLDPAFQHEASLLGQSARGQAQSDPMAQLAQYAGLGKANELMNTDFSFMGPEQQQQMLDLVKQMSLKAQDPRSFNFDTSGRQEEQYGNLQNIIAGGGADAIERAMRLRARQDSESWLRGQREADLQSYGERGLGGSGLELQSLSQAQQGAAGRNALADAEMAAALEKRKLDTIGSAADLASTMRGQAIDEQSLFAGNQQSILGVGASIANAMRTAQMNEQLGAREAQNKTLGMYGDLASKIRDQSFDEAYKRGEGVDDFLKINTDIRNATTESNVGWLRDMKTKLDEQKYKEWVEKLRTASGAATDILNTDVKENEAGYRQGTELSEADAKAQNEAREKWINSKINTSGLGINQGLQGEMGRNDMMPPTGEFVGQTFDEIIKAIAGGYGGASMGIGGGAGAAAGASSGGGGGGNFNLGNWSNLLSLGNNQPSSSSGQSSGYQLQMPKTGQGGFDYSDYLKRTGGQW